MTAQRSETQRARRAVEALRNGVPNREAVRALGCSQPRAEQRFVELLRSAGDVADRGAGSGMLVSGDFGTGKSHLLAYLEHRALENNFVCSRVAVSKETPLYDLGKLFVSAMESALMPDRKGRFIEELSLSLNPRSERYARFSRWAEDAASEGRLSQIFPASLCVHEETDESQLREDIEAFWAGDRIQVSKIKSGLRLAGQAPRYRFRAPKAADLPPQRLPFAVELIKAAGYRGWVVLLDEIELIGSYSILQRGRSYTEVARWMGQVHGHQHPGLVAVGAVTADFASAVISPDGQKRDRDYVRPRLERSARYEALGPSADTGMRLLEQDCLPLEPLSDDEVQTVVDTLRRLYHDAYDWEPPRYEAVTRGAGLQRRMRYKVRAAINEWDLLRLHPDYRPETEIEDFTTHYEENADLEQETPDDSG